MPNIKLIKCISYSKYTDVTTVAHLRINMEEGKANMGYNHMQAEVRIANLEFFV